MRKLMTKEVTHTLVKVAKMGMGENGLPVAEQLPDEILIGNASLEKAQKEINKKYAGQSATVFGVEPTTEVYEMAVEDFIRLATKRIEQQEQEQTE